MEEIAVVLQFKQITALIVNVWILIMSIMTPQLHQYQHVDILHG
jgi:hypothetical protein